MANLVLFMESLPSDTKDLVMTHYKCTVFHLIWYSATQQAAAAAAGERPGG